MNVSIFGLGYVGCVSAACLARDGFDVIGVDINPDKVNLVRSGRSPIVEPGLQTLIEESVRAGRLSATQDSKEAVLASDVSLICVGTPSNGNGSLKMDYVESVCREIAGALAAKPDYHVVVLRSTVLPGTLRTRLLPILERCSGKRAGVDFGVCVNPEFLREGSAIRDYDEPSLIVIGELDPSAGDAVASLYEKTNAPVARTAIETAETVKYANNAFHALKVVFANEIGTLCKAHGIDGQEVMDLVCQDKRLNISAAYLRPGFAFGGSCLPKDTRALLYRAKERDVEAPLLHAVLTSNQQHIERAIKMVENTGRKQIGVFGLGFKPETDDIRESPTVQLVETLVGRGYQVRIFDDQVELGRLMGANKAFLEQEIPHITLLMRSSLDEVIAESDVLVIANGNKMFRKLPELVGQDQTIIDLVGIAKVGTEGRERYEGICW